MKQSIFGLVAFCVVVLWTSTVLAHDVTAEKPWKNFNVALGASFISNDGKVRIGAEGVGVELDPEELLGLQTSTTVFRLDGFWRFTHKRRHRLDFTYYSNRRDGTTVLDETIEIGDTTIPVNTKIETTLNFDIYRVGYSYSFFQDERMDLGVGAGLYVLPVEFKFDAEGILTESIKESFAAPLPVINLRADFAITDRWSLRNRIDLFYLQIDNYRGAIVDTRIAVEYQPFKHVGFGLAFDNFRLAAEAKEESNDIPGATFQGTFKFRNSGLMLYLKANY